MGMIIKILHVKRCGIVFVGWSYILSVLWDAVVQSPLFPDLDALEMSLVWDSWGFLFLIGY